MHITQVHFRAFDKPCVEIFLTEEPLTEVGIKNKIRPICYSFVLVKVIQYECTGDFRQLNEMNYDTTGALIKPLPPKENNA